MIQSDECDPAPEAEATPRAAHPWDDPEWLWVPLDPPETAWMDLRGEPYP